jgi:hypothetical protein
LHNIKNPLKSSFKSKSQNIWHQIILFSSTVMQMICTWPEIWPLSGRLSLMRKHYCTGKQNYLRQIFCDLLLKSAFERIFNVMQLILVKIKWHIKWKYLIQKFHDTLMRNVQLMFIFSSQGHDRQSSDENFSSRDHDRQSSEQNNRKLISLHINGEVDKHCRFLVVRFELWIYRFIFIIIWRIQKQTNNITDIID